MLPSAEASFIMQVLKTLAAQSLVYKKLCPELLMLMKKLALQKSLW
jgi:hypothetical protein